MDLTIKKKIESPLLSRTRVTAEASYKGSTPSEDQIKDSLASKLGTDKSLVCIRHIYTKFGEQLSKVIAHVYENKKDLDLYEVKTKKQRKAEEEAVKKAAEEKAKEAEAPAEPPKEEATAEATPVEPEPKAEEKPEEVPKEEAKPAEEKKGDK
ncbi:MAG: hypothetical protein U9R08_00800 [Nanoarchaeota archaeon]|nr:hypothetical protein [Nanoarchaeota archaeon]